MVKNKRAKRSAFTLAQYDKAVFYRCIEKPSFNKNPDGVQVRVRKSELAFKWVIHLCMKLFPLLDVCNIGIRE